MTIRSLFFLMSFWLCNASLISVARADVFDLPKVSLVSHRLYSIRNEGTAFIGYFPMDPFDKYISLGASYTHGFSDFTGWEIFNIQYAIPFDSGLKQQLISGFAATPSQFNVLQVIATSNIVFSPLYVKNLFFNSSMVHSTISFTAGGGVANFSTSTIPVVDIGIIMRYFLSTSTSLKFDCRDDIFMSSQNNNLNITAGLSFHFGRNPGDNP